MVIQASVFPGFDRLYDLADPGSDRAFVATIDVPAETALPMLRGEIRRVTPIEGRWAMGSAKPLDVVWTTLALPALLGQRVVDLLRKEQVTGWDFISVQLAREEGRVVALRIPHGSWSLRSDRRPKKHEDREGVPRRRLPRLQRAVLRASELGWIRCFHARRGCWVDHRH